MEAKRLTMRKKNKFFIYVLLLVLTSCIRPQDVCNYNGNQVVSKGDDTMGKWFRFRKDGKITHRIHLVEYDWNKYEVGDTINCQTKFNNEDLLDSEVPVPYMPGLEDN